MQLCMMSFACKQNFYEDIFEELSKYGELESLNVCDNMADHMVYLLLLLSIIESRLLNAFLV